MKRLSLLGLLLTGCCVMVFGQKIRFTDSSNRWHVEYSRTAGPGDEFGTFQDYRYRGDTILNGIGYKRLDDYETLYYPYSGGAHLRSTFYIREDTVSGRIYSKSNPAAPEQMIYNGRWQLGDSILESNGYSQFNLYLRYIDSMQIRGVYHKIFCWGKRTNTGMAVYNLKIIEGLGSLGGPVYPTILYDFEEHWNLWCFENQGSHPLIAPALGNNAVGAGYFDNSISCNTLGIDDDPRIGRIRLVPNPGGRDMVMKMPSQITDGRLLITDGIGKKIVDISIHNVAQINIGQYIGAEGVYYYTLQDKHTGQRYTGRFTYR